LSLHSHITSTLHHLSFTTQTEYESSAKQIQQPPVRSITPIAFSAVQIRLLRSDLLLLGLVVPSSLSNLVHRSITIPKRMRLIRRPALCLLLPKHISQQQQQRQTNSDQHLFVWRPAPFQCHLRCCRLLVPPPLFLCRSLVNLRIEFKCISALQSPQVRLEIKLITFHCVSSLELIIIRSTNHIAIEIQNDLRPTIFTFIRLLDPPWTLTSPPVCCLCFHFSLIFEYLSAKASRRTRFDSID
jgi:hypothetical protein